ncbi:TetR family transcriptional regulator [Novosphingobium resinovorum]|uniref:TetR family transcriptional regulator n=1 Tax=Novosphingobium resinovorum TaxID=158500 RepID=UPI002ED5825A|nr:TetR family transcriptional regulator [Novosphingobium resinovorum]
MAGRGKPGISVRKAPRQARSNQLVDDILTAAARVLAEQGAHRFTTARVAERAGVSVGSLYQYFPNKASILFRLQTDEWRQNVELLCGILEDRSKPPLERLGNLVHAFVRSELEEAEMRVALADAAPFYRDAELADDPRERATGVMRDFMAEVLPDLPVDRREIAMETIKMTMSETGKRISEERHLSERSEVYADAVADMFCAYLDRLSANG